MSTDKNSNPIIYQARLHWVIFLGPILWGFFMVTMGYYTHLYAPIQGILLLIGLVWTLMVWLTYRYYFLMIKQNRVVLCTGIIVRQTIDIPMNKIESIDIRQSILGTLLQYGALVITGTGGTRQCVNFLNKPLTCRRYIEQLMLDAK